MKRKSTNNSYNNFVDANAKQNFNNISRKRFESIVDYDTYDTGASPVIVYIKNNTAIAWMDTEMQQAYKAEMRDVDTQLAAAIENVYALFTKAAM